MQTNWISSFPSKRCLRRVIALFALASALGSSAAAGADGDDDGILEMSLEELLEVELDRMAVTGIHHTHERGEWMVGYSFMFMEMEGNRDGTRDLSPSGVLARGFMVSPTRMNMAMHMFNAMYGVTDRLTAMVMVPYIRKTMDHIRMDGVRFTTKSRGIGDVSASGLYELYRRDAHQVIGVLGLSFPTGSISESDNLPGMAAGVSTRLPYPMQLGSGSFDLLPGMTYIGQRPGWQWGLHADGTVRLERNRHDYRLGNAYEVSAWGAKKLVDWASASIRLVWDQWLDIHGADAVLNPAMVPTANPNLRAGRRLMIMLGVNLFADEGRLKGLRGTLEGGIPAYQHLDGPQLETDWSLNFNLEWNF